MNIPNVPVPFRGNKQKWIKYLYEYLKNNRLKLNKNTIIVDVFGGTGILSILFKKLYPNNVVIYNDYDNFLNVLKNDIAKINNLKGKLYNYINNELHIGKSEKIPKEYNAHIFNMIKHSGLNLNNPKVKNIISNMLNFNGRPIVFNTSNQFYNKTIKNDYLTDDYLNEFKNIKVIHQDYKKIIETFENTRNVFYILDPPYLQTGKLFYKNEEYFNIDDTINIIKLCIKNKAILFESTKSQLINLIKLISEFTKVNYTISESQKMIDNITDAEDYFILFNC